MKSTIWTKLAVAAIAVFGTAGLMAQVQAGQGVARISLIHGDVSTQRGDSGDTAAAALNAPVVTGDKISTGDNSRAEVQLDFANILRLSERSQANVASLTEKEIQIQISQGSASYTAFKHSEIRPEVDTTNLSVRPSKGDVSFRIDVVSGDETDVTVRKGEVEVSTSTGSRQVRKGQVITVRGTGEDAQFKVADARGRDDWDKWNDDRDHLIRNAESVKRTSPYYVGSQDLDSYGHWSEEIPDYGHVWIPTVPADWTPYHDGRWVWEPYYGWTWVSYEPWGWAPYHYGRWFYYGASWVWWPGPVGGYGYGRYYRPVWAPAYVSFFGFGGGIGIGFGSFGWLPIGPCDSFYPWYGGYSSRFNQVNVTNITNVTNVTNIYNNGGRGDRFRGERPLYQGRGVQYSNLRMAGRDARIRGAISTVPAEHFGSGRVVARGMDPGSFREARMMTGNLPVVPTRESLNASNKPASSGAFRGAQPGRFFGTNRPAASPHSFDRQAEQVQQDIQRDGHFTPIRSGEVAGGRNVPAVGSNPGANRAGGSHAVNRGTDSLGSGNQGQESPSPQRGALTPQGAPMNQPGRISDAKPGATEQQGWHRFSGPAAGPSTNRGAATEPHDLPMNRGTGTPTEPRGPSRDQRPARGGDIDSPRGNGDRWQHFPPSTNRGSEPIVRENGGNGPADVPANPGDRNGRGAGGNTGWDRGPRGESPRGDSGPANRGGWDHGPASTGDSGRGSARPPLDMRQPVVVPRAPERQPSAAPRGGSGRGEGPPPSRGGESRPPSGGGGGRGESHPPSGGGGHPPARPSGGGRNL
jgi:hypothetical protein